MDPRHVKAKAPRKAGEDAQFLLATGRGLDVGTKFVGTTVYPSSQMIAGSTHDSLTTFLYRPITLATVGIEMEWVLG